MVYNKLECPVHYYGEKEIFLCVGIQIRIAARILKVSCGLCELTLQHCEAFCEFLMWPKWGGGEATEYRSFDLSVAADIAQLDFMSKMPFRLIPIQGSY